MKQEWIYRIQEGEQPTSALACTFKTSAFMSVSEMLINNVLEDW